MPKILTRSQIEAYNRDGFVFPVRVMSESEARELRAALETYEAKTGGPLRGDLRHKTHLLFTWLADLVRRREIVDAIEDLYGENILCWSTNFFIKEANNPSFVSWHQDATYWGLSSPDVVTAWVALTEATAANGAMDMIPGTHMLDQIPHRDTFAKDNLLTRGQEIMVDVDGAKGVKVLLSPGEMSLHHVRIIHGSAPNTTNDRRIGIAIRYIPTRVRQLHGNDSATLVRGVDTYKTFEHEPRPAADMEPRMLAMHKAIAERNAQILFRGTGVRDFNDPKALADNRGGGM
ncbi:MAG TPA: phytanoyl-CoA dioxygenase family protein [Hyphomicrobiaceae bacterium]|nr:phytanoyl-CoA dioxygenase family protein [Hyphomicrobiaceae bacterium]